MQSIAKIAEFGASTQGWKPASDSPPACGTHKEETSMSRCPQALKPLALAASLAMLAWSGAQAQTQTAAPAAAKANEGEADQAGTLSMERIVVTGTTTARTKMKQSVSVSTLDPDQIQKSGAVSAAEVLRSVPGIRAESSGGEGNANITVRGAPISAGGSRYLQLQEDGLPVILVGDISFGTADQFVRADGMTDSVQAIRGGSASTLATNSPAGIVNFITKTGRDGGGSAGLTVGLDHNQARLDFDLGGRLGPKTRFQIGGFQRIGEGARPSNVTLEDGGQLRMNLTQDFDGGYLRLSFKHLDDKTPTYLPVPVRLSGNKIETIAGVDPRTAFFINSNFAQDRTYDRNGNLVTSNPSDGPGGQEHVLRPGTAGRRGQRHHADAATAPQRDRRPLHRRFPPPARRRPTRPTVPTPTPAPRPRSRCTCSTRRSTTWATCSARRAWPAPSTSAAAPSSPAPAACSGASSRSRRPGTGTATPSSSRARARATWTTPATRARCPPRRPPRPGAAAACAPSTSTSPPWRPLPR
jgi:hypothetical protein